MTTQKVLQALDTLSWAANKKAHANHEELAIAVAIEKQHYELSKTGLTAALASQRLLMKSTTGRANERTTSFTSQTHLRLP